MRPDEQPVDRLLARIERLERTLNWYRYEAEAIALNVGDQHMEAVIASIQVLSLDGGMRARDALAGKR